MHELLNTGGAGLRRRFRNLWASRGGGYYGLVAALTFLYLEAVDLAGDLGGIGDISINLGWLISFFVNAMVDAFLNGFLAAIWPVHWIGHFGVGIELAAFLAGSYVAYRLVRPGILRLLDTSDTELAVLTARSRDRNPDRLT
jgi:hypothetical protein